MHVFRIDDSITDTESVQGRGEAGGGIEPC